MGSFVRMQLEREIGGKWEAGSFTRPWAPHQTSASRFPLPTSHPVIPPTFDTIPYLCPMAAKKHLIVIGGPTASGKTTLSIELAKHFGAPILSADSRQFYREMSIGTAKPGAKELAAAKHYFVDNLSIEDPYSVGDYERAALALLDQLYEEQDIVIMAGGSGLFIKAVCEGMDRFPNVPAEVKAGVQQLLDEKGMEALQAELEKADPDYYKIVDLHNPHRLIRALGVCRASGQPFTSFWQQSNVKRHFEPIYILTEMEREALYERINKRVDLMLENGLVQEAKSLYPKRRLTSLQTVGYRELFEHFDGTISMEKAIELIKRNSRRYAKRQMTWLRGNPAWKAFAPSPSSPIIQYVEQQIKPETT